MGKKKNKKNLIKAIKENIKEYRDTKGCEMDNIFVSGDDLVYEVNQFDKEFGVRLKHPNIWFTPEKYKDVIMDKCNKDIGALLCILNGVPISTFYNIHKDKPGSAYLTKPQKNAPAFTDVSKLKWRTKESYKTDSIMFRNRFATMVGYQFVGNIQKIVDKIPRKYHHSKDEMDIINMNKFMEHVTLFCKLMCSKGAEYKNVTLKMHEYLLYKKKNPNITGIRLGNLFMQNIKNGLSKSRFEKDRFADDDMAIYEILKAAFTLATGSDKAVRKLPKFDAIEGATTAYDLSGLIEELGRQILKENGTKFSPIFKAYLQARPYVKTDFVAEANHNVPLNIGIYAISFVQFIINDNKVTKFIKKMLETGI